MDARLKGMLEEGREKFLAREFPAAEKVLEQVCSELSGFADVHNMLGVIWHDQGKFAKALEAFEQALKINPAYTEACLNLAVTYNDLGMYHEARAVYARASQGAAEDSGNIDPFVKGKLSNMHADLADVYSALGQFQEAILEYRKALAMRPDFADIRTSLGKALREVGRKEDAIKELTEAKSQRPKYAAAGVQLGLTWYTLGRSEDARNEWNAVLTYDPQNSHARMYLRLVTEMEKKR